MWRGNAGLGLVWRGTAGHCEVRLGLARPSWARFGEAGRGLVWLGEARLGQARPGRAGYSTVWSGVPRLGRAVQGMDNVALKALRKKLGLSLAGAAARVHVTPRTWARYEAGERKVPEGVVHLFCIQSGVKYPP